MPRSDLLAEASKARRKRSDRIDTVFPGSDRDWTRAEIDSYMAERLETDSSDCFQDAATGKQVSAAKLDAWDAIVRKVPQYARDAAKGGNPNPTTKARRR